jgi:hypothetical protein
LRFEAKEKPFSLKNVIRRFCWRLVLVFSILINSLGCDSASLRENRASKGAEMNDVIYTINKKPVKKEEFDRLYQTLKITEEETLSGEKELNDGSLAGFTVSLAVDPSGKTYRIESTSGLKREEDISPVNP